MQLIQFLRSKVSSYEPCRVNSEAQDLALYRQLRRAENKLYAARDCLDGLRTEQNQTGAEHTHLKQLRNEPERPAVLQDASGDSVQELQPCTLQQHNSVRQQEKSHKDIELLERDIKSLEAEYQAVQKKVRSCFYFEPCQGRLPETEAGLGQAPQ